MLHLSQMERRRILSQQRDIHDFLEKKADHAFQGEFAAQTRLSEAQAELDGREWERRNADLALYETGRQLESQRMELYQANQLSDQVAILAQAILSQEAYGILLLPLHSNRIDCCLSLSCVWNVFVQVVRLTDHDASFVFASSNSVTELCGSGARVAVTQQ